ncbi:MAG TPA: extracellular solute-binding protein [Acetobacteraceae bacterium]|jgi:raffinose/stachyose/melibiose transport system substrate-binding protein|nr:extracellular solute-binding protein [Acetobacteraceae bacterium]
MLAPSRRAVLAAGAAAFAFRARAGSADDNFAPPPTGAANAKKIDLRFATNYAGAHPMAKLVRDIIAQYAKDYPNVTVAIEESPGDAQMTRIKLDASADRLPDLFNYWRLDPGFGLDQVAHAGKLADLTAWTHNDPFFKDLFDQYSWRTATLDGKVYGVPINMFYLQFLANKAVFDRAGVALPTDWDSLMAAVKALKAKGEIPWAISIGNDSEGGRIYNTIVNRMFGNARALRMHAGAEPIDVPEMVTAMQMLHDLVVGYTPQDAIAIGNDSVYAKYVNTNRGGLIIDGSWVTPVIKPEIQEHIVVLKFPLIPGGAEKQMAMERDLTSLWYASAKSMADADRRPYVQELIRRLSSRAAEKRYAEEGKQPIAALGVELDEAKYGRLAWEAQTQAMSLPANKWIPSVLTPTRRAKFEPALGEFLSGKQEPRAFVTQLGQIMAS